jgi:hypothetical protein
MKKAFFLFIVFFATEAMAQEDTIKKVLFEGYADVYYGWDFRNPRNHLRPGYLYNHNRHNEVNLNLAILRGSYTDGRARAAIAVMAGTYAQYNLAHEQQLLRHIFEANVGVKLSRNKNLWLDAGVFPSHIGFESVIQFDNWTLSRSILAENSPYYEAGARITYISPNEKLTLMGLALNGWQRITRIRGQQTPGLGHQLQYRFNKNFFINSSSFVGNENQRRIRFTRFFHNFYGIYERNRFGLITGIDVGMERVGRNIDFWYAASIIGKYSITDRFGIAARYEYYEDPNNVIIAERPYFDFRIRGVSFNTDYLIRDNVIWRVEWRYLDERWRRANQAIFTSLAIKF